MSGRKAPSSASDNAPGQAPVRRVPFRCSFPRPPDRNPWMWDRDSVPPLFPETFVSFLDVELVLSTEHSKCVDGHVSVSHHFPPVTTTCCRMEGYVRHSTYRWHSFFASGPPREHSKSPRFPPPLSCIRTTQPPEKDSECAPKRVGSSNLAIMAKLCLFGASERLDGFLYG